MARKPVSDKLLKAQEEARKAREKPEPPMVQIHIEKYDDDGRPFWEVGNLALTPDLVDVLKKTLGVGEHAPKQPDYDAMRLAAYRKHFNAGIMLNPREWYFNSKGQSHKVTDHVLRSREAEAELQVTLVTIDEMEKASQKAA